MEAGLIRGGGVDQWSRGRSEEAGMISGGGVDQGARGGIGEIMVILD